MTGTLQPLANNFQIVDVKTGLPTDYFIRWAQQRQIDISGSISGNQAVEIIQQYLTDHPLQAGTGIDLSPSGNLVDSPTIAANVQAILNTLTTTRGSVIFRGATNWQALAPGAAGRVLQTNGASADPTWVPQSGGGGGGAYSFNVVGTASTTPQATKGGIVEMEVETTISEFVGVVDAAAGATYRAGVYKLSAATITEVVALSGNVTGLAAGRRLAICVFSTPVTLLAGTRYFLALSRVDATDITSASIRGGSDEPFALPSTRLNLYGRIALMSPGVGAVLETGANSYCYGLKI